MITKFSIYGKWGNSSPLISSKKNLSGILVNLSIGRGEEVGELKSPHIF